MQKSVLLTPTQIELNKREIIKRFARNVKGKVADVSAANIGHDGKYGHWLETAMGVKRNNNNAPDLLGFEMKNATLSKTTFGDWSADYRIFSTRSGGEITQDQFLQYFGQPNAKYSGRLAWSGRICPKKVGPFNDGGQRLTVDANNNILAIYSYSQDKRHDKDKVVPMVYRRANLVLCKWSAELMRERVERKFNQNGWFKCIKNSKTGIYTEIVFGDPITFENWIAYVKAGDVIFDSGMHQGNARPYANWRSSNVFWEKLVTTRYG